MTCLDAVTIAFETCVSFSIQAARARPSRRVVWSSSVAVVEVASGVSVTGAVSTSPSSDDASKRASLRRWRPVDPRGVPDAGSGGSGLADELSVSDQNSSSPRDLSTSICASFL